jgi:hypothetical protein
MNCKSTYLEKKPFKMDGNIRPPSEFVYLFEHLQ